MYKKFNNKLKLIFIAGILLSGLLWGKAEGRRQKAEGRGEEDFNLLTFVDIPSFIGAYLLIQ